MTDENFLRENILAQIEATKARTTRSIERRAAAYQLARDAFPNANYDDVSLDEIDNLIRHQTCIWIVGKSPCGYPSDFIIEAWNGGKTVSECKPLYKYGACMRHSGDVGLWLMKHHDGLKISKIGVVR